VSSPPPESFIGGLHFAEHLSNRAPLSIGILFPASSARATPQSSSARSFGVEGKYQTTLSVSKGGDCIDYKEEDPEIMQIFEKALAEEGIKSNMAPSPYA
jgi:hypothetical protein